MDNQIDEIEIKELEKLSKELSDIFYSFDSINRHFDVDSPYSINTVIMIGNIKNLIKSSKYNLIVAMNLVNDYIKKNNIQ